MIKYRIHPLGKCWGVQFKDSIDELHYIPTWYWLWPIGSILVPTFSTKREAEDYLLISRLSE
jgi:hypothetical protein